MAHTYDTKARGTGTSNPQTVALTCGSSATLLVVGIACAGGSRTGGAPTYNSVALTQAGTVETAAEGSCEVWYLLGPSTGSSYNISVPNTGSHTLYVVGSSYISSTGTSALDATNQASGTTTNTSVSVTTTADGDVIVEACFAGADFTPMSGNQTLLYSVGGGNYSDNHQYALQSSAGAISFTWSFFGGNNWATIVASFKETTASATVPRIIQHLKQQGIL